MNSARKTILFGAAVVLLATALAMAGPLSGIGQEASPEIDLTGPVRASSCLQCHESLGESRSPGLTFDHETHLPPACNACHIRPAHEAGIIYSPPMSTCFACHGLVHGVQGLVATAACDYCHTPEFELRPAWHVETWAEEPHAGASLRGGTNGCILCHDPRQDCDACHAELAIDTPRVPPIYVSSIPTPERRPPVTVDPTAAVTMGQCFFCHPVIDREWPDLIFTHDTHLMRDYRCETCHESFPHGVGEVEIPTMISCYRCHGLLHAAQGEVAAGEDCLLCHPPAFELIPADHTPAFIAEEHAEPARDDMPQCTMCHASTLCSECHRGERELDDGTLSLQVIPDDHQQAEWIVDHGGIYLGGMGACSVCHTSESCQRCHFTPMPHSTTWLADHTANGYPRDDCKVCHQDRASCQECHHGDVRDLELVAENCVDCHPVMATEPATDIKEMGFAEHAVHFGVEESIGRPYVCDDCHVGFTVARVRDFGTHNFATQAHDLRICYDCHGALDSSNIEIAPWPGSQLCRRCHADLNI
ncbi:MAG: cytochrome c3 family protein [Coriobacteriia bacterium]|nr:cytochrome c3 family protein [Coriobacteriia bacterium]